MRFARSSCCSWRVTAAAVVVAGLFSAGCGSPERAPRQPVSGVDRPWPEDGGPSEEEDQARVLRRESLDAFVGDLLKAREAQTGPVAVFWPLSDSQLRRGDTRITGLGERVAQEVADELRAAGITPIAGETLINDIKAAGRCLHDLRGVDDVFWLAQKISAVYVAYGYVNVRDHNRLRGERELAIDLHCKRLGDNKDVARLQRTFPHGRKNQKFFREFDRPSQIAIGDAAVPCPPADREDVPKTEVAPKIDPKTSGRSRAPWIGSVAGHRAPSVRAGAAVHSAG